MQEKPELTLTESRSRHFLFGSLGTFALFLLAFVVVPYVTASASAATRIDAAVDWGSVSMTFDPDMEATASGASAPGDSGHGNVDFGTLTPSYSSSTSNGTMKVLRRRIGVTTTGNYYTVYLSSVDNTTGLALTSTVDGTPVSSGSGVNIPSINTDGVSGTFSSPASFGTATGWGYAVPGVDATGIEDAPSTFVVPALVGQQITGISDAPGAYQTYHQTTWAGVAPRTNPQQIWKAQAADELTGFSSGDSFDVYYGVMINENTLSGSYSNEVVYTALASASALDRVSSNLSHNRHAGGKGDIVNLSFDLADSLTSVTKSMVKVALVPHSVMLENKTATDDYQISGLNFSDYPSCPIVSFTHPEGNEFINLSCVLPDSVEGDQYDFWIKINSYNIDYISKDYSGSNLVASLTYAGLQTEYPASDPRSGQKVITEMQDMTEGVCSLSNAWGTGTGTDARVYNYTGTGATLGSATSDTDQLMDVGTFQLTDNRDDKPYLVRRLADGNCWMVQNLDLDLASFAGTELLTSKNTDLNSKDVWDPSASALAIAKEYDPTVTQENYFETFAINRLGNAQKVQFQPKGLYGTVDGVTYHWGTEISTQGEKVDGPIINSYAKMPRSYDNELDYISDSYSGVISTDLSMDLSRGTAYIGDYYNWYAATAESGVYAMTPGYAQDSVCPSGWQLPLDNKTKSFISITSIYTGVSQNTEETLSFDDARFEMLFSSPLSISFTGDYLWDTGNIGNQGGYGALWTSNATTSLNATCLSVRRSSSQDNGTIKPEATRLKNGGLPIRCVARGATLPDDYEPEEDDGIEIASCSEGKICYSGNGATSGEMSDQTIDSTKTTTMLTAPLYKKDGYAFAGWSTEENGFGAIYGPNQIVTTSELPTSGLQLYAKWLPSSGTLQDFTAAQCAALDEHAVLALTDSRDNKTYSVAKLKDGNCWMTQNLALDLTAFTDPNADVTLNSSNTDLNSKTTWTPDASTLSSSLADATTSRYRHYSENDQSYYNWYAATAESGEVNSGTIDDVPPYYNPDLEAKDSVCPAGWRLPTATNVTPGTDKSYLKLLNKHLNITSNLTNIAANDDRIIELSKFPLSFEYSGNWSNRNDAPAFQGTAIDLWTSTPDTAINSRRLNVYLNGDKTKLVAVDSSIKVNNIGIRCVQR